MAEQWELPSPRGSRQPPDSHGMGPRAAQTAGSRLAAPRLPLTKASQVRGSGAALAASWEKICDSLSHASEGRFQNYCLN